MPMKTGGRRGLITVYASIILCLIAGSALAGKPPADAIAVGTATCLDCHDEVGQMFGETVHGRAYSADTEDHHIACESCHGLGSAHVEETDPALIFNPGDLDDPDNSSRCVTCHTDLTAGNTFATAHYEVSGGCADCHVVHSAEGSLKKQSPQLCFDCHTDKRAQAGLPSHHPIIEGRMGCIDCHEPHGREQKFATGGDNRELCFSCHPAKQGPFIFEHAPAVEDCSICHDPHGTVADNLLVKNEPTLCLSCHPAHFHSQITGYDGTFAPPLYDGREGVSSLDGFKSAMLTKCTQCHGAIHGTDLSSQSITAPGALTR